MTRRKSYELRCYHHRCRSRRYFSAYELTRLRPALKVAVFEAGHALEKVAPGTANDDTLLYGVEVKFYNMEVEVSPRLETRYPGLYIIGDGSGITHSLSHASAGGIHVARNIAEQ